MTVSAVLDTNVLASGLAGLLSLRSVPGQLLRSWNIGAFSLVISEPLFAELERTLSKPYFREHASSQRAARMLDLIRLRARLTPLSIEVHGIATHPEDDLILATALSAPVDYLVTGDRKLQALGVYQGVAILTSRAFLDLLLSETP